MNPRLLRPLASGFNPKTISGLAGWWDASDPATLFDATTGGSLVAASGEVGRWEDKSGNGRHCTQGTANNRPKRSVAKFNGKDALDFDGTNDSLGLASPIETVNGASIIIVTQKETNTNGAGVHSFRGTTLASRNHHPFTDNNGYDGFGRTVRTQFSMSFNTSLYVHSTITGSQYVFRRNENVLADNSYTAASQLAGAAQVFGSSDPDNISFFWDGFICEALVYTRGISSTEFTAIYRYLSKKWGVA
jgi:hypothetical protein